MTAVVPRLVLAVGGTIAMVAGVAGMGVGIAAPAWLLAQLPGVIIDAAAVGGAAFALGAATALAGLVQLAAAALLGRAERWIAAGAAVLCGLMAFLLAAISVALATQAASGAPGWLLAVASASALAALAYALAALTVAQTSI